MQRIKLKGFPPRDTRALTIKEQIHNAFPSFSLGFGSVSWSQCRGEIAEERRGIPSCSGIWS